MYKKVIAAIILGILITAFVLPLTAQAAEQGGPNGTGGSSAIVAENKQNWLMRTLTGFFEGLMGTAKLLWNVNPQTVIFAENRFQAINDAFGTNISEEGLISNVGDKLNYVIMFFIAIFLPSIIIAKAISYSMSAYNSQQRIDMFEFFQRFIMVLYFMSFYKEIFNLIKSIDNAIVSIFSFLIGGSSYNTAFMDQLTIESLGILPWLIIVLPYKVLSFWLCIVIYLTREVTILSLYIIGPVMACINLLDERKGGIGRWVEEMSATILTRSIHALLFTALMFVYNYLSKAAANAPIVTAFFMLVFMAFIVPSTNVLRGWMGLATPGNAIMQGLGMGMLGGMITGMMGRQLLSPTEHKVRGSARELSPASGIDNLSNTSDITKLRNRINIARDVGGFVGRTVGGVVGAAALGVLGPEGAIVGATIGSRAGGKIGTSASGVAYAGAELMLHDKIKAAGGKIHEQVGNLLGFDMEKVKQQDLITNDAVNQFNGSILDDGISPNVSSHARIAGRIGNVADVLGTGLGGNAFGQSLRDFTQRTYLSYIPKTSISDSKLSPGDLIDVAQNNKMTEYYKVNGEGKRDENPFMIVPRGNGKFGDRNVWVRWQIGTDTDPRNTNQWVKIEKEHFEDSMGNKIPVELDPYGYNIHANDIFKDKTNRNRGEYATEDKPADRKVIV